ncbi:MAG: DUF2326 domain-containing protein [Verrucomicrobiaceae bacterium]|nr:MAG: DUF2326 domain-containing protein [Verrucomicrobiaceae bacterium]
MIKRVGSSLPSFECVDFKPAFNLIVADRDVESGEKETRNGAGKSLLLDIINFCLGSKFSADNKIGRLSPLKLSFWTEIEVNNVSLRATREVSRPDTIFVQGLPASWAPETENLFGEETAVLPVKRWTEILGEQWFGLPDAEEGGAPTFRALMQFLIRTGMEGFLDPFVPTRQMQADQRRMLNSFLLGLDWELAVKWKDIHKREQAIKNSRNTDELKSSKTYLGRLESDLVQLEQEYERSRRELASFRVVGQYSEIQSEADLLTSRMQKRQNANFVDKAILSRYESSVLDEPDADPQEIARLYGEAGVVFGESLLRRLDEVNDFHRRLVANRKSFVSGEVAKLQGRIRERESANRIDDERRSELMSILESGGALDEYVAIQQVQERRLQQIAGIRSKIEKALENDRKKQQIAEEKAILGTETYADFELREHRRREAIRLFSEYLSKLFEARGRLVIGVGDNGYEFETDVERESSEAVDRMTIFCYDLVLAKLWSAEEFSPRFLFHDSTMFEGWDERQIGSALQLAHQESSSAGFQYVACFNTDAIPAKEYFGGLQWEEFVRVRLNDTDAGTLLGFRY